MSLGLNPTIFNSIEVIICIRKKLETVDFHVVKVCDIENILGLEGICANNAIRGDLLLDDWQRSFRPGIGFDDCKTLPFPMSSSEALAIIPPNEVFEDPVLHWG
jgi:hypothetical protein